MSNTASGNSFTLNSQDYGAATLNVYVMDVQFPAVARPRVQTEPLADADGVASWGSRFGPITFRLECMIAKQTNGASASTTDLDTYIDNVVTAWKAAHAAGPTTLTIDLLTGRTWANARPLSGITAELMLTGMPFSLEIMATDPVET